MALLELFAAPAGAGISQRYRDLKVVTGEPGHPGHDPEILVATNIELLKQLREAHPRIGQVGIVDCVRIAAPVQQLGAVDDDVLAALKRPGMELVEAMVYDDNGRPDVVIGWKGGVIVDQASTLPMVFVLARGKAYEGDILLHTLLPMLRRHWPDCPIHTLIGDAFYDTEPVCRALVEQWSIQPIFTRHKRRQTTQRTKGGGEILLIDGVPQCPRCEEPTFKRREGWHTAKKRLAASKPHGEIVGDVKSARTRWSCRCGFLKDVSLYAWRDPREHTFWPRDRKSGPGIERRAYEIGRNGVESNFAHVKHRGVGTLEGRCLWVRDAGMAFLFGLEQTLQTARRVAHENGDYKLFELEYKALDLHLSGEAPTAARMRELEGRRPSYLRQRWSKPGRAGQGWSEQDAA